MSFIEESNNIDWKIKYENLLNDFEHVKSENNALTVRNKVLEKQVTDYYESIVNLEYTVKTLEWEMDNTKNDLYNHNYRDKMKEEETDTLDYSPVYISGPIEYIHGAQGKYYVVNGHKYHETFPYEWAINHTVNSPGETFCGPARCMDCAQGKLRGVFVKYCCYCQELFQGTRGNPDKIN